MLIVKKCNSCKGFTLVELLISLAIVSIVTLTIFSLFNLNIKSFAKSAEAMKEQANLRLISYKLTKQLRNIGYIDLDNLTFNSVDEIAALGTTDYFIFTNGNVIKTGSAASITVFADDIINDISFSLKQQSNSKYLLGITITGKVHSYTTEVLLNNIITSDLTQMGSGDIGQSGFTSIRFNYNLPPYASPPEMPTEDEDDEDAEDAEDLSLIYPEFTVEKGETFVYEATAVGGVSPYTYNISIIRYDGDAPVIIGNTISWNSPNGVGKSLEFKVSVTDYTGFTLPVEFIINTY